MYISVCLFRVVLVVLFQFVIYNSRFILFQSNHSLAHLFWGIRYLRISPFSPSLNRSAFKLWHFIFVFVAAAASAGHIYSKNRVEVYVSDRVGFGHMFSQDRRVDDRLGSGTPRLELKQNLKTSRKGYKGHVTRIRNEIEALMVSREYECVRGKLANLEPAFTNFRHAHEAYVQCLDDPKEIFEATTWFEDLSDKNRRFVQRFEKWLDGSQRSLRWMRMIQPASMALLRC